MMSPERAALYYRLVGYYYGYPTCCIEDFVVFSLHPVDFSDVLHLRKLEAAVERFVPGFIPCGRCLNIAQRAKGERTHRMQAKHNPLRLKYSDIFKHEAIDLNVLRVLAKEMTDGLMARSVPAKSTSKRKASVGHF